MNRSQLRIAAVVAVVLLVVLGLYFFLHGDGEPSADGPGEGETPVDETETPILEESFAANLFFPDGGFLLHGESRDLPVVETVEERIAALVEALLAGPSDDRFRAPLPADVSLRKVYIVGDTTVFLDLESAESGPPPASGSRRELLTVYSLVNTVLLNTQGLERVVLLWNGQQPTTFAGHLDTARPLTVNHGLIASAS